MDQKKKDAFNIDPENEQFAIKLRASGYSDTQIGTALVKKKQLSQEGVRTDTVYDDNGVVIGGEEGDVIEGGEVQTTQGSDMFGGKTKQEVLQFAFQSGVTKKSTLQEIADTYDLVMGEEEETPEQKKLADFDTAEQFILDNPEASREELKSTMLQYTSLDSTRIDSILNKSDIKNAKDMLTDDDAKTIATSLMKDTGFFTNREEGKAEALAVIESDDSLNSTEKEKVKSFIKEQYPEGRTFLQRILLGGK